MSDSSIAVTYTLTEAEFVAAQILFARAYKNTSLLWTVFACAIVLSLVEAGSHGFGALSLPTMAGIFAAELVTLLVILWIYQRLARAVLLPRQASRAYRKNADMQAERMLTWDGDSFTSRTAHGRATLKWHDIVSILQDQTNLLLFISKTEFLVVPQRAFTAGTRAALLSHLPHAQPAHPAL